jgi:hypothetical protein
MATGACMGRVVIGNTVVDAADSGDGTVDFGIAELPDGSAVAVMGDALAFARSQRGPAGPDDRGDVDDKDPSSLLSIFRTLVSGNLVLVAGGKNVVPAALPAPLPYSQSPTTINGFGGPNLAQVAPRTIVGVDQAGRLVTAVINGCEDRNLGMTLNETATFAAGTLGLVAAVNLDGGGSSVAVAAPPGGGYGTDVFFVLFCFVFVVHSTQLPSVMSRAPASPFPLQTVLTHQPHTYSLRSQEIVSRPTCNDVCTQVCERAVTTIVCLRD